MVSEKETGMGTGTIEWLSEIQRELNVKRFSVKITVRLGYNAGREIMYVETNVYDKRTGKLIDRISRTAEDGALSVIHIETLVDFYNSVIDELINGNTPRRNSRRNSRIDGWL